MNNKSRLTFVNSSEILTVLKNRFDSNMNRHENISWKKIMERLANNNSSIESLIKMEESGGEPDVIGIDEKGRFIFCDCSDESPAGRRSYCYDDEALRSRKENKPKDSAVESAKSMGIEIMYEEHYRYLQTLGEFDLKTSSWIKTPDKIRSLDGALFADRRFDTVFVYHNTAPSYYAARGYRGILLV